jgi:hypothetical protein
MTNFGMCMRDCSIRLRPVRQYVHLLRIVSKMAYVLLVDPTITGLNSRSEHVDVHKYHKDHFGVFNMNDAIKIYDKRHIKWSERMYYKSEASSVIDDLETRCRERDPVWAHPKSYLMQSVDIMCYRMVAVGDDRSRPMLLRSATHAGHLTQTTSHTRSLSHSLMTLQFTALGVVV